MYRSFRPSLETDTWKETNRRSKDTKWNERRKYIEKRKILKETKKEERVGRGERAVERVVTDTHFS